MGEAIVVKQGEPVDKNILKKLFSEGETKISLTKENIHKLKVITLKVHRAAQTIRTETRNLTVAFKTFSRNMDMLVYEIRDFVKEVLIKAIRGFAFVRGAMSIIKINRILYSPIRMLFSKLLFGLKKFFTVVKAAQIGGASPVVILLAAIAIFGISILILKGIRAKMANKSMPTNIENAATYFDLFLTRLELFALCDVANEDNNNNDNKVFTAPITVIRKFKETLTTVLDYIVEILSLLPEFMLKSTESILKFIFFLITLFIKITLFVIFAIIFVFVLVFKIIPMTIIALF